MTGILYLSYSGMLEPLGQSQVLAYLERLAGDQPIHLVSFERLEDWRDAAARASVAERIRRAGIVWHPQRYHKRFSVGATAYDIATGIAVGTRLVRRHGLSVVHARSYVPGTMALAIKRLTGAKFLFDMRGFWADERVDGGIWPKGGRLFRTAKAMERRLLLGADAVVSLTHAAAAEIGTFAYLQGRVPPITVIPTCADLDRFSPDEEGRDANEPFVLGYVGGAGTWYLFDEAVLFYAELKRSRPDARLLLVNRKEHAFIRERLHAVGLDDGDFELIAADHNRMPKLIRSMDAGIALIKPVYSKTASAPTKLAEFLGCGVPCLANNGVGDMQAILEEDRTGVVLGGFTEDERRQAVKDLLALASEPDVAARCVRTAQRHFALAEGVARYQVIYRRLANDKPEAARSAGGR